MKRGPKNNSPKSIRVCRHHGSTEFNQNKSGSWFCIQCHVDYGRGIRHPIDKEPVRFVKLGAIRSIRICKRHGKTEFSFCQSMNKGKGAWSCLQCSRDFRSGIRYPKEILYPTENRICRHHGLTEFQYHKSRGGKWSCKLCKKDQQKGIFKKHIPGSSDFVGLYIAEQVLRKAFDVMIKAHPMEKWDFICGKGFTVDSKCSTHRDHKDDGQWRFNIEKNKAPKFFCCIALDNTPENVADDPRPIHVWLIPGDAIINGKPLNEKQSMTVSPRTMAKLEPYRRTDMEGRIIKCCNHLKDNKT